MSLEEKCGKNLNGRKTRHSYSGHITWLDSTGHFGRKWIDDNITLESSIGTLPDVSYRVLAYFRDNCGINSIGDLVSKTPEELRSKGGVALGLKKISRILADKGFYFKGDPAAKKQENYNRIINEIKDCVSSGITSVTEVSYRIGISYHMTKKYAEREGIVIWLPKAERLRKLLEEGKVSSIEDVCTELGVGKAEAHRIKRKVGVNFLNEASVQKANKQGLSDAKISRRLKPHPEIDERVLQGLSLEEIGNAVNMSREGVRQYLIRRNQYDTYKKLKKEIRHDNDKSNVDGRKLVGQILGRVINQAYQDTDQNTINGWAQKRAADYVLGKCFNTDYSFDILTGILTRYRGAQKRGKSLTLRQLREGTLLKSDAGIGRILKSLHLPLLSGRPNTRASPISTKEKSAIKRSLQIPMTIPDLAYFLGMKDYVVEQFMDRESLRDSRPEGVKLNIFEGRGFSGPHLSYRLASQIYEAQDAGYFAEFSKEEVANFFDSSQSVIDYALQNKRKIVPTIKRALQIIYSKKRIDKPYLKPA